MSEAPGRNSLELAEADRDALSEMINIGFGRAASALSMLVSQRVLLEAPEVEIHSINRLHLALTALKDHEIINVHQVFRGKLSGDAMLLMDQDSAAILVDMLNGGPGQLRPIGPVDREALVETGNILLNAFIGSFGNLLKVYVTFTVPHLRIESLADLLNSIASGSSEMEYGLIIRIHFRLSQGDVNGYVIIVMGIQSLEVLIQAMRGEGFAQ